MFFVLGKLSCKFHGGYHGNDLFLILVLFREGYHGGMIGNITGKVLFLFFVLVFYFFSCLRQVTCDRSKREL
jgi:hypothetical protein